MGAYCYKFLRLVINQHLLVRMTEIKFSESFTTSQVYGTGLALQNTGAAAGEHES